MQLLIELTQLLALPGNLAYRVQHRRVVPAAKQLADLGQALLSQFFGQVHRNLAGPRDRGRALC